jgi:UPF0716 protein FxsA
MRFVLLAIVLVFPLFDLYVTARFARWTGIPLWIWIIGAMIGGVWLLKNERLAFRSNVVAALHGEQSLFRELVDSGRKVLAGLLLILPGVLSDVLAMLLLLLPINHGRLRPQPAAAGRGYAGRETIDGEYRRTE